METISTPSSSSSNALLCLRPDDKDLYEQFAQMLIPIGEFCDCLNREGITAQPDEFGTVEISRLSAVGASRLPGLNEAKCVYVDSPSETSDQESQSTLYVFKGADFSAWLERRHEKRPCNVYKRALYSEHSLKEELTVLCTMPPHPNIIPRPPILVSTPTTPKRICGFLQPFRAKQTISEQIRLANKKQIRIPPLTKAQWCLGIAEGILHTHRVAKIFHMDMKPANVLIEDDDTVRIIDWQQQGMCRATHPPEATLGFTPKIQKIVDKMRLDQNGQPIVIFTPQSGPGQKRVSGMPTSNGKRRTRAREETIDPTIWSKEAMDIPGSWRETVEACLIEDPAKRPALETVAEFWKKQVEAAEETGSAGRRCLPPSPPR
ncbi:phosphotransferase enzyme family protein [Diaporthe eres]|nr:phosphotransferase enzyme family protein [Diaporthe eres]